MLPRSVPRAALGRAVASRRAFHTTRIQRSGHDPDGPYHNMPFDARKKSFVYKFWGFCGLFPPEILPVSGGLIIP